MPKVVFTEDQHNAGICGHMALTAPAKRRANGEIGPLVPSGLDPEQMGHSNLKAIVSDCLKAIGRTNAAEQHPISRYEVAKCRIRVRSKPLIAATPKLMNSGVIFLKSVSADGYVGPSENE